MKILKTKNKLNCTIIGLEWFERVVEEEDGSAWKKADDLQECDDVDVISFLLFENPCYCIHNLVLKFEHFLALAHIANHASITFYILKELIFALLSLFETCPNGANGGSWGLKIGKGTFPVVS